MAERPFVYEVQLLGPKGKIVRVHMIFDDSAMICVMCAQIFKKVRHRLQGWQPSKHVLRMANRALVKSQAMWTGMVRLGKIKVQGTIEVFDSGGGWLFLFRKPMLQAFKANHNYKQDIIQVRDSHNITKLKNQIGSDYYTSCTNGEAPAVTDWKHPWGDLLLAVNDKSGQPILGPEWSEVPIEDLEGTTSAFTRQQNPFSQAQVDALLKAIEIRSDVTEEQKEMVHSLIAKYADCFALSVKEVILAKDAMLQLDIPEEAQLPTKICQHTFSPPQRRYLHKKILEMLEVGIIKRADPAKIKCVSQTTLGQKQHEGAGLTLEEL
jgi:hypothetical protein